jgi:hypothetical protein
MHLVCWFVEVGMPGELVVLAESAASVLVNAATTDTWHVARDKILRLFGRDGKREAERAGRQLDRTAQQIQGTQLEERGQKGKEQISRLAPVAGRSPP